MSETRWYQKGIYLLFALALVVLLGILPQSEALAQPPQYWAKSYGGDLDDRSFSIQQTSDGGYIVAGYTASFGAGNGDFWVLKLEENGDVTWQKAYGGNETDCAFSIQQTLDEGYIVAGYTRSFGFEWPDLWVLKLASNGDVTWQKTYRNSSFDCAFSIQQTSDGGYIVAGYTASFGAGNDDFWVLKLEENGDVTWQKRYGGSSFDYAYSIQQTTDEGYIVAGYTDSFGAGNDDFWVLKLDENGGVTWQKTYGDSSFDYAHSIQQTSDGGYIVAGETGSLGAGHLDFWVLKLDENGTIPECPLGVASNGTATVTTVKGQDTRADVSDTDARPAHTKSTPSDTDCSIDTQCFYPPPPPPPPPPVGGDTYPVNKVSLLAPWIAVAVLVGGISWYVLRRRRAQSRDLG